MRMNMVKAICANITVAGIVFVWVSAAHANCYSVYKDNVRVYHSQNPPVDTSFQYSETVPIRFGVGATMVVVPGAFDCPSEGTQGPGEWSSSFSSDAADAVTRANAALESLAERYNNRSDSGGSSGEMSPLLGGDVFGRGPILTGPRGGQFYINSNGNKSYVSGRRR